MMNDLQKTDDEKSVLRWGGLAGMLSGILFILTIITLLVLVPEPATEPKEWLMNDPVNRTVMWLGESLALAAYILSVTLYLALYRALRGTSLASALFGTGLVFLGFAAFAAGALPNIALAEISDLYHAPGATPGEQTALIPIWHAIQGVFYETDTVGFIFLTIGLIVLGVGMLRAPAFGKGFGGVSIVVGVVGVVGVYVVGLDSVSFVPIVIFTSVIFPLLFGWKVYSLSRSP
jgi:hypothetical membrane protein